MNIPHFRSCLILASSSTTRILAPMSSEVYLVIVSIFASYFWLWSLVGLLCLLFVSTLGAVMNFMGFVTPLKRFGRWMDDAPMFVKLSVLVGAFGMLAYPSVVHRLWADATALETRSTFSTLPAMPGARA